MNSRSLLVALTACGIILAALIVRSGGLLALAIPFLVFLIIGLLQAPGEVKLEARRIIDDSSIAAGEAAQTRLLVTNRGDALVNLSLEDALDGRLRIKAGEPGTRRSLAAGETARIEYAFSAPRGVYVWQAVGARAADPFGLFEVHREIPARGALLVRPVPLQLHAPALRPRFTMHTTGTIPVRRPGSGTDFLGIREYRVGDPLRHVNWRMAARYPGEIFTNEYERQEITDFGIILDARRLTQADAAEEALFERSTSAAAALAEVFLQQANRVSLLIFGETLTALYPGYGKKQLNLILRSLAHATLGRNLPFGYLEYCPVRLFPSRATIIILSSVTASDLPTYARLRSLGYDVLLISPDPVRYGAAKPKSSELGRRAFRLARVERIAILESLLKLGVQVLDWKVDTSLDAMLQAMSMSAGVRRNLRS